MEPEPGIWTSLVEFFWANPVRGVALVAAILAMASTPVAFAILSRGEYLFARRGRVYRRPEWWSVVCSMMLVMGIPAITLVLLVKSEYFDRSRYEFDPNEQISVLDQGRQYQSIHRIRALQDASNAVRSELKRLRDTQAQLDREVTALGKSAGTLGALANKSPELGDQLKPILERLEALKRVAHVDQFEPERLLAELQRIEDQTTAGGEAAAIQFSDDAVREELVRLAEMRKGLVDEVKRLDDQLIPLRAAAAQSPPMAEALEPILPNLAAVRRSIGLDAPQQLLIADAAPVELRKLLTALGPLGPAPVVLAASNAGDTPTPAIEISTEPGLSTSEREAELGKVPQDQRELAALLPLTNLPEGWEIGKSGDQWLETFNADNLYEKIDGRAESFLQYDVLGMAYTYYHPEGDASAEVQLYIFEMGNPLKALGKFGSEKPEEIEALKLGAEGYASGASVFFHAKQYYIQIVATSDDDRFKQFATSLAARISEEIQPGSADVELLATSPDSMQAARSEEPTATSDDEVSPDQLFALLPEGSGKTNPKYVAQDVFGYSFLSDVFMADYAESDATWQAFIRTYADPAEARTVFDQYRKESESFGASISDREIEGAEAAFQSENFGQFDLILLKGNAVAGVNGATVLDPALAFFQEFAQGLPVESPVIDTETSKTGQED